MDITVNYKIKDYIDDLKKTSEIKIQVLYATNPFAELIIGFVVLFLLLTGIRIEETRHYLVGTIFVIIGVIILALNIVNHIIKNKKIKQLRNLSKTDGVEFNSFKIITLTENMFAIRFKETYDEYNWNAFESYFLIDDFIFFIINNATLHSSFFINKKQLHKKEYEELITFLASKLPVWKR